eukprot:3119289-Amphidinium_carterae.1
MSDNDKHYAPILTMLGYATIVPYKGVNTEAVEAILRFIVENGLQRQDNFLISRCKHHHNTAINHKAL